MKYAREPVRASRTVVIAACLVALPSLTFGGALDPFVPVSCEHDRDTTDIRHSTRCHVSVPNGDLLGAPPPVGTETGKHRHPWEPGFSWLPKLPRPQHAVLDHLAPWEFHGRGTPSYPAEVNGRPGVVLSGPDDAIFQWIPVPPLLGNRTALRETRYLVRVTYAPYNARGNVGIAMKIIAADAAKEYVSVEFDDVKAGSPDRPVTFEGWIAVPPGAPVTQVGVAVGKTGDAVPLVIQQVAIVEETSPYLDF